MLRWENHWVYLNRILIRGTIRLYHFNEKGAKIVSKEEAVMNVLIGIIGTCAAALLVYYVNILMMGDKQK